MLSIADQLAPPDIGQTVNAPGPTLSIYLRLKLAALIADNWILENLSGSLFQDDSCFSQYEWVHCKSPTTYALQHIEAINSHGLGRPFRAHFIFCAKVTDDLEYRII